MPLDREIAAYARLEPELRRTDMGRWALLKDDALIGIFQSFAAADDAALAAFGDAPCLIRQIGAGPVTLPVYVCVTPAHAGATGRVRLELGSSIT